MIYTQGQIVYCNDEPLFKGLCKIIEQYDDLDVTIQGYDSDSLYVVGMSSIKPLNQTYCCKRCGDLDIKRPHFVNLNTDKIDRSMDWLDDFCPTCKSSSTAIPYTEYTKTLKDSKCMSCKWEGNKSSLLDRVILEEHMTLCPKCYGSELMDF